MQRNGVCGRERGSDAFLRRLPREPRPAPTVHRGTSLHRAIDYLVGWKAPVKGNKHDFFLLRDPDSFDGRVLG